LPPSFSPRCFFSPRGPSRLRPSCLCPCRLCPSSRLRPSLLFFLINIHNSKCINAAWTLYWCPLSSGYSLVTYSENYKCQNTSRPFIERRAFSIQIKCLMYSTVRRGHQCPSQNFFYRAGGGILRFLHLR
jgi:hypothetical protein